MKKGFSLIELLLVISLISILSVFSVYGTQHLLHSRSHSNAFNQLKHTLYNAQSNSQNTGFTTVVCPSNDSKSCNPESDWSTGWIAYNDANNDKILDIDEKLVIVHKYSSEHISINFNALGNGEKIVFYPTGRLWPNGNFIICHRDIANKQKITTTISGRLRFSQSDSFD